MANFPQELHSIVLNKRQLAGGFAPSPPKGRQVPTKQQRRRMWPLRCARRKGGSPAFRQSSMCHRQLIGEIWTRQHSSSPAHRQSCHEGQKHWHAPPLGSGPLHQPPNPHLLLPHISPDHSARCRGVNREFCEDSAGATMAGDAGEQEIVPNGKTGDTGGRTDASRACARLALARCPLVCTPPAKC